MAGPRIGSLHSHGVWDRSLTPALRVAPGTEVVVERFDLGRVNPCTGPVAVDGLAPGEGLSVTILDISPAPWAWTANIPGFGLLAEDFPSAHLWISKVGGGRVRTPIGVEIEARPMIGTIGVAPAEEGPFPILVPAGHGHPGIVAGGRVDAMGGHGRMRTAV